MPPSKLGFIDALRGLAALYVLLYHFTPITTPQAAAPRWLAPFTGLGGSGVTLFFVVSAFTLCLSMDARRQDEATPLLNYYLRRFFRIAPLFYVWIVLYCIRDKAVFDATHSISEIARSVFFVLNVSPGHEQGFVWASWTLGVEMLFYIFFPAIFRRASNIGRALAFFFITLMIRALWHAAVTYLISDQAVAATYYNFSLLHHLPTFALGIVAYRAYKLLDVEQARRYGVGELLTTAAVASLLAVAYGLVQIDVFEGLTIQAAIYGTLLIGLAIKAPAVLVNRVTRFYGKISYSVYLCHATTIFLMSKLFAVIYSRSAYVTVAYFLSVSTGLVVITFLSWLTYRFVETPGNNLGKAAIRAIQRRRAGNLVT
ncbi:acyltransferase [Burkholderia mayonis]|uniref:Acyltransferase n=1 Tax=Burkholderia mayonis TaxID=1385591 RepID=A0A1B4FGH0_9BURK|nr:acyltransferase [Burkholderia mayonis]AOJ02739.1 acyltransferase [Burkholderia mayonis]KVE45118.1 acyltransferase [Burkholderia mayonis]